MFNKLKVYCHVATMFEWKTILTEVLEDVRISTLKESAEITIVSVGKPICPSSIPNWDNSYRLVNTSLPLTAYEFPTLQLLREELEPSTAICYLHLKGVSCYNSLHHRAWRRELLEFTIIDWAARVIHLHNRWTSGPRIVEGGSGYGTDHVSAFKHYSGNFWWARSDYLELLNLPKDFAATYKNNRYAAESWLGQDNKINELIDK